MKIFFVRHGKDDDRFRGGWSRAELLPEGVEQAKRLAKYIAGRNREYNIDKVISSDLPRAATTAGFVAEAINVPLQTEPKLREMNNGELAGMLNETALELYPGLFFSSLGMDEAYPNGESPRDFFERISTWFAEFISGCKSTNGNIMVVTHGGVINILYHIVRKIEWSNKAPSFKASNCGIHILNTDTMDFETENETDFLTE